MRRLTLVCLVFASGCMLRQAAGDQSLTFSVPATADTLLARARTELTELGYEVTPNEDRLVITNPRPVPDSLARSAGSGTDFTGHLWVLRVSAEDQVYTAGSRGTVAAFVFPVTSAREQTAGNVIFERATPVTRSSTPGLFNEIERVAERIQAAAARAAR